MGPTWGPSGADRTQVGPMFALWTLPSGYIHTNNILIQKDLCWSRMADIVELEYYRVTGTLVAFITFWVVMAFGTMLHVPIVWRWDYQQNIILLSMGLLIRKLVGCACARNAVTHVPWCIPGSLTSGFLLSRWRGKRSQLSRRMRNPQFYVWRKRPIEPLPVCCHLIFE